MNANDTFLTEEGMAYQAPNVIAPENVSGLIHQVMKRGQLRKEDITDPKKARVAVPGIGQFDCTNCKYNWLSFFSWVTINLKEQVIEKRWRMMCKTCGLSYEPTFSIDETEIMTEKAVCAYKGVRWEGNKPRDGRRRHRQFRPPHAPELCEKCGYQQTRVCWSCAFYFIVDRGTTYYSSPIPFPVR